MEVWDILGEHKSPSLAVGTGIGGQGGVPMGASNASMGVTMTQV